jgi:hypothetical protein
MTPAQTAAADIWLENTRTRLPIKMIKSEEKMPTAGLMRPAVKMAKNLVAVNTPTNTRSR